MDKSLDWMRFIVLSTPTLDELTLSSDATAVREQLNTVNSLLKGIRFLLKARAMAKAGSAVKRNRDTMSDKSESDKPLAKK